MRILLIAPALLATAGFASGADRKVDPTFLRRNLSTVAPVESAISAPGCVYKAVFGGSDADTGIVRGVTRFGEIDVTPGSACKPASYASDEQVYVVLDGNGSVSYGPQNTDARLKKGDFLYVPPALNHTFRNTSAGAMKVISAGFRVLPGAQGPSTMQMANIDDVQLRKVEGHPDSVGYRLLIGDAKSTRDKIAAGRTVVSVYTMEFAPGGTNTPHHHDAEEEIYVLLEGRGDMVAGGGMNGVEGRHPAKPGDAYFFRLNCTVGFYNTGERTAKILAFRSTYPRAR